MICNYDELEFNVISIDRFYHKTGAFDVKARPYAAFSFRLSGSGEFDICGKRISVKSGDLLFIPADTPYKVEYSFSESVVVHFSRCNYSEAESICINNSRSVEHLFQKLLDEWNRHHSVNKAKSVIYEIFDTVLEDKVRFGGDEAFCACVSFIEGNFCDYDLDMKTIAGRGYISVSSLQRRFREYLETSPMQYLIKLRMNKAMELLIAGELSVRDVALACGFVDEKYFSKAFKTRYGYSPSQIKKHVT